MDLQAALPTLLPKAIAWAETESASGIASGQSLPEPLIALAHQVGVTQPDRIRIVLTDVLPSPADPVLQAAAEQAGLAAPHMAGLTLGYAVFVREGHESVRLLSHEFRHVYQYEQAGSIGAFFSVYLPQVLQVGYEQAPLEVDARAHEETEK